MGIEPTQVALLPPQDSASTVSPHSRMLTSLLFLTIKIKQKLVIY